MTLERAAVALESTFDPAESLQQRCIVREVMRRAERGLKTILVVGASGARERADAARAEEMGPLADPLARAIVLNSGAIEAAALLSRSLAAMGVSVAQLDPRLAAPTTTGHALDARPRHADARWYERTLTKVDVVVVPGGVGLDADRRATNLGEDGAALTASFLADALAIDLVTPRRNAGEALEQIPGRKARLLARDRNVRVRVVEPGRAQRSTAQPGPLRRLADRRAVPA
ncbi:MAG: hypothetical protein RIB60_08695 [Phycisphaerales bacterium]